MGLECSQDPTYGSVSIGAPLQRGRDITAGFHDDGYDDVPKALARSLTHHTADRLHDVDLAVTRIEERNSIELRDVDALSEELDVTDHLHSSSRSELARARNS